ADAVGSGRRPDSTSVFLSGVGNVRTVVAHIADAVAIGIRLVRIGNRRTIVITVTDAVTIAVGIGRCAGRFSIELVGADAAVGRTGPGTRKATLVEVVDWRRGADGLVAGVDCWAARLQRDRLRRAAVVGESRGVEVGVGRAERRAGGGRTAG